MKYAKTNLITDIQILTGALTLLGAFCAALYMGIEAASTTVLILSVSGALATVGNIAPLLDRNPGGSRAAYAASMLHMTAIIIVAAAAIFTVVHALTGTLAAFAGSALVALTVASGSLIGVGCKKRYLRQQAQS